MSLQKILTILGVVFLIPTATLAQAQEEVEEDMAPQEAPYIQEDNEFDNFVATPEESADEVPDFPIVEVSPSQPVPAQSEITTSAKGGVEYIRHPQAAHGLTTITKEGAYIYRTEKPSTLGQSGSFRLGMMDYPRIVAADGTTYETMYSKQQNPYLSIDFEWQPFQGWGKLGAQAGFGILLSSGNGRFLDPGMSGQEAKEKYTFIAIPLNLGIVYRLQFADRQWVAPFVAGGGTYIGAIEFRDDDKNPSTVGTPGAYGAAGLLFNVTAMDRESAVTLANDYGINNLWVSLEYRYLQTFTEDLDFSSNIISGGITVDY